MTATERWLGHSAAARQALWIANRPLELEPGLKLGVHFRREEPEAIAAVGLALAESEIGALQDAFRLDAVLRGKRDADAGGRGDLVAIDDERLCHRVEQPLRQALGLRTVDDVGLNDREFVAAEPADDILGARR